MQLSSGYNFGLMKPSPSKLKGIKVLLSQLRSEISVESKNRFIPKKCVCCLSSTLVESCKSSQPNHFSITVPEPIEKELFLEFNFWRCKADGSRASKNCKQNAYTSKTHLEIQKNFGCGEKIYNTRKNRNSSLKDLIRESEETVPIMPPSITPLPQNVQSRILEKNVCLMDKRFFENF